MAKGGLLTFEPNDDWAQVAYSSLSSVRDRFESVLGTFEDNIDNSMHEGERIELPLLDASHICELVTRQVEMVLDRAAPHAIVLIDDINFSNDMRAWWRRLSTEARVRASAAVDGRIGVLEHLPRSAPGLT